MKEPAFVDLKLAMLPPLVTALPRPFLGPCPRKPISPCPSAPGPMSSPMTSKKESVVPAGQFAPITSPDRVVASLPLAGRFVTLPSTAADATPIDSALRTNVPDRSITAPTRPMVGLRAREWAGRLTMC